MRLTGQATWTFQNGVYVQSNGTTVGPFENKGPLYGYFDKHYDDFHCGEESWEMAERTLMRDAVAIALQKKEYTEQDIDLFLAGDLLNQNATANYFARELKVPFLCMFGACSTSMETLAVASAMVDAGFANRSLAATSSHNCTAEKQFRYPTEYGGQKPDTSTFTVTGAGALVVSKEVSPVRITHATIGTVQDFGLRDPFDMGSAMAPAAAWTIRQHLQDTNRSPEDYDYIITGDLSAVGSPILCKLLEDEGIDIHRQHVDCGNLIYYKEQETFAGGSGCACSAVVTYGYFLNELMLGRINRIFVVATGALLNPVMIQQKETIPCIAHGVVLERVKMEGET